MKMIQRLSLRHRIVVVILAVVVPVVVMGLGFVMFKNITTLKQDMLERALTTARTVGGYVASDLYFGDEMAAREALAGLSSWPAVEDAYLYDETGHFFTRLNKSPAESGRQMPPPNIELGRHEARFRGDELHVIEPIRYQGSDYGAIYLRLSTAALDAKVDQYELFLALTGGGLILLAYLLANLLQGLISRPVLTLTEAATRFTETLDYSQRVRYGADDEIGRLYTAFNEMLARIEQQQRARERSELRLKRFFDATNEGVLFHEEGRILDVNPGMALIVGYQPEELVGHNVLEYVTEASRPEVVERMRSGSEVAYEAEVVAKSGVIVPVEVRARTLTLDGKRTRVVSIRDISERKLAEQTLQQAYDELERRVVERTRELADANARLRLEIEERKAVEATLRKLSLAVEQSPVMVMITDHQGIIEYVNPKFTEILGYSAEEVLGQTPAILQSGETSPATYRHLWETIRSGREWRGDIQNRRKSGEIFWERETISPLVDEQGNILHYVALKEDITEHKRNEQALREAKEQAEQANRAKSEFLANMSHELRTPLNSIIGFTGILKDGMAGEINEEQKRQLEMVYGSARHLLDLINDILDLSKVEAGKVELVLEEFELMPLLEEVRAMMEPLADAKGLALHLAGFVPERLHSDRGKLRQVLVNLLGNAIKFTERGSVALICQQRQQDILFEVTDTGIGLSKADLDRIFGAFEQVDGRSDREYEGTGLGLAISRRFVEMLGGSISVRSRPGEGSTFQVRLADVIRPAIRPASRQPGGQPPADAAVAAEEGRTVLVVDDDDKTRELLRIYLQDEGYTVITAANGLEAMALARTQPLFAITLDIMMPGQDGWTTLAALKEDERTREIPVIIISILDEQQLGLSLGAVEYLTKPVDKAHLRACLALIRMGGKDVLVVDDSEKDAELLHALLEPEGYRVRIAHDGPGGLAAIGRKLPDLLLLDLMMPGMSGFEVIRRLRADPATARLPVIIVSAKTLTEAEADYLQHNTEGLLVKGDYERADMLREVADCLAGLATRPGPQSAEQKES